MYFFILFIVTTFLTPLGLYTFLTSFNYLRYNEAIIFQVVKKLFSLKLSIEVMLST